MANYEKSINEQKEGSGKLIIFYYAKYIDNHINHDAEKYIKKSSSVIQDCIATRYIFDQFSTDQEEQKTTLLLLSPFWRLHLSGINRAGTAHNYDISYFSSL